MAITYSPVEWSKPAARAEVCPKLRRNLTTTTRRSTEAICCSIQNVLSSLPSSTKINSNDSLAASITTLRRSYSSVTLSSSLWKGTTMEYLSTVCNYTAQPSRNGKEFAGTNSPDLLFGYGQPLAVAMNCSTRLIPF